MSSGIRVRVLLLMICAPCASATRVEEKLDAELGTAEIEDTAVGGNLEDAIKAAAVDRRASVEDIETVCLNNVVSALQAYLDAVSACSTYDQHNHLLDDMICSKNQHVIEPATRMTLVKWAWWMIEQNLLPGSCGQTSGWLYEQVKGAPPSATRRNTQVMDDNAFGNWLGARIAGSQQENWYARVEARHFKHSFIIEKIGNKARIYESFFGKYTMVRQLKGRTAQDATTFLKSFQAFVSRQMSQKDYSAGVEHFFFVADTLESFSVNTPGSWYVEVDPSPKMHAQQVKQAVIADYTDKVGDWPNQIVKTYCESVREASLCDVNIRKVVTVVQDNIDNLDNPIKMPPAHVYWRFDGFSDNAANAEEFWYTFADVEEQYRGTLLGYKKAGDNQRYRIQGVGDLVNDATQCAVYKYTGMQGEKAVLTYVRIASPCPI